MQPLFENNAFSTKSLSLNIERDGLPIALDRAKVRNQGDDLIVEAYTLEEFTVKGLNAEFPATIFLRISIAIPA